MTKTPAGGLAVLACGVLAFLGSHLMRAPSVDGAPPAPAEGRLREGTRLENLAGSFQLSGTRFLFVRVDGKAEYVVLENLSLERVARTLEDSPSRRPWTVNGTVTEFRGANYLLVHQATVHGRSDRL